jgi:hypothetical protein
MNKFNQLEEALEKIGYKKPVGRKPSRFEAGHGSVDPEFDDDGELEGNGRG